MEFKKSLKKFRLDNNLTQDELGQKLGLSGKVISKWESGYTMPDIEKIKLLCEVFNCDYADLIGPERKNKVNTEKAKEEVFKPEKCNINKQDSKILKSLSKILYVFVKIFRIVLFIGISVFVVCMIITPSVVDKIDIHENSLSYRDFKGDVYYITKNNTFENNYVLKYNNRVIDDIDFKFLDKVNHIFANYSKNDIIFNVETVLIISLISVSVSIVALYNFELFVKNIHDKDTPFTKENIHYLGMTACLLIAIYFCKFIISTNFNNFILSDINSSASLINIFEIVFMLIMMYIFKYGYNMQEITQGKIYEKIKD